MADDAQVIVNGKSYELPEQITAGELVEIELAIGRSLAAMDPNSATANLIATFVAVKRAEPATTWEEFSRLGMEAFRFNGDGADDGPPTKPRPKPARAKSNGSRPSASGTRRS